MTGLQEGRAFSEVVTDAKAKGYTEPDPRDDLGGVDVARKALILARGALLRLPSAGRVRVRLGSGLRAGQGIGSRARR